MENITIEELEKDLIEFDQNDFARDYHLMHIAYACALLKNKVDHEKIYNYINGMTTLDYNLDSNYLPDMMKHFQENNIK